MKNNKQKRSVAYKMGTKLKPCKACGKYHQGEPTNAKHMDYNLNKKWNR
jgi:hypothetical protein